jgi:hypothetical protein
MVYATAQRLHDSAKTATCRERKAINSALLSSFFFRNFGTVLRHRVLLDSMLIATERLDHEAHDLFVQLYGEQDEGVSIMTLWREQLLIWQDT